jgi:hypothetical protein
MHQFHSPWLSFLNTFLEEWKLWSSSQCNVLILLLFPFCYIWILTLVPSSETLSIVVPYLGQEPKFTVMQAVMLMTSQQICLFVCPCWASNEDIWVEITLNYCLNILSHSRCLFPDTCWRANVNSKWCTLYYVMQNITYVLYVMWWPVDWSRQLQWCGWVRFVLQFAGNWVTGRWQLHLWFIGSNSSCAAVTFCQGCHTRASLQVQPPNNDEELMILRGEICRLQAELGNATARLQESERQLKER